MTCDQRQEKLAEWLLDELSAEDARELGTHVQQCPACAEALTGLRQVVGMLREQIADREMPARLVFLADRPAPASAAFWPALGRAAALGAVAAAIFLAVVWVGVPGLVERPAAPLTAQAGLTPDQVEALVAEKVEERLAGERRELAAAQEEWARRLQAGQALTLAAMVKQLEYLEATQRAVWQENQQQNAAMQYIAASALRATPPSP